MKKYLAFFRLRFVMGLQYRAAALGGIVTQFFWGFMLIMIYKAFYDTNPESFPMTLEATTDYIWLQQAFFVFFTVWMMETEIMNSVVDGSVAYELCRPVKIYNLWLARSVAMRCARVVLRCFPIIIVAALVPAPIGLSAPKSVLHLVLFLITLIVGLFVTLSFCMIIYGLTFFTVSPQGLKIFCTSAVEFLAGGIIPLPFFPENIRRILEILPFAAMQNVPLRVYSGDLSGAEMGRAIALQFIWLIFLVSVGYVLCNYAEKKVTVQGG